MIYAALALWFGVFGAVANPKTQEIFNREWWWRIPALVALFAVLGPFLGLFAHH
jgi:hypothetical protein